MQLVFFLQDIDYMVIGEDPLPFRLIFMPRRINRQKIMFLISNIPTQNERKIVRQRQRGRLEICGKRKKKSGAPVILSECIRAGGQTRECDLALLRFDCIGRVTLWQSERKHSSHANVQIKRKDKNEEISLLLKPSTQSDRLFPAVTPSLIYTEL